MKKILILILAIGAIGAQAQNNVRIIQSGTGYSDRTLTLTTAATGTNWTAFSSFVCTTVVIINDTGTKLAVRTGGSGNGSNLPDGSGIKLNVSGNANDVSIRRADTSNTQVTVTAWAGK